MPLLQRLSWIAFFLGSCAAWSGASAQVADALHQQCLKAADYQGCVKANSNGGAQMNEQTSGGGVDRFGLPVLDKKRYVGPETSMSEGGIGADIYTDMNSFRMLKHNGTYGRYIAYETLVRFYRAPSSGSPGFAVPMGGGGTSCYGSVYGNNFGSFGSAYGSSNCTTTPPTTVYLPGEPGSVGGPMQYTNITILDCIDMTSQVNRKGRWKKIQPGYRNQGYCKLVLEGKVAMPKGEEFR
jgi:hypothetical protein